MENIYQWIPAVDELLLNQQIKEVHGVPRMVILDCIREVLGRYRRNLGMTKDQYHNPGELKESIIKDILAEINERAQPSLRPVINATGVVLHTNLGRAVLSEAARQSVDYVASGYSNLELNLDSGERGSRYAHVEALITRLTGAESCLVVNNNAAAVLLALDTLAKGKETIVSRGELVEIGGAFRVPDVMERSGSRLVEVGTTNKTYIEDYQRAIVTETGLLLKVHTSNYRIIGFTQEPTMRALVELGNKYHIPVMEDLGSGCLYDLKAMGIGDEPTVQQVVASGVDVVTFSGDKLLGGPQAGIIAGKEKYISQMKKNPLTRALRIDKMTVAALEATLKSYLEPESVAWKNPTLEMLTRSTEILQDQANQLKEMLAKDLSSFLDVVIEKGVSQVGGGSLPGINLPTFLVVIKPVNQKVDQFASALRGGTPAVLTYIRDDKIIIDPRTVLPSQYEQLISAIRYSSRTNRP
ncbi:MAG: L-seryl-tRNA(Sec) selenium transferase [Dehalobacterium sp.]